MSTAAVQTQVQRCGEDQDDWQHIHGCCRPEWDPWSREQSGREAEASDHADVQAASPYHDPSTTIMKWLDDVFYQDKERQQAQIGIVVEFAIAMIGKLDGINRHSFNNFRLRVGESTILSLNKLTDPALLQLQHVSLVTPNNII